MDIYDFEYARMVGEAANLKKLEDQKNGAYRERDMVLALAVDSMIAHSCHAWLGKHPETEEWENDWRNIVYIELPNGKQLSWHIHDSEMPWFAKLNPEATPWDGHTTEEKYERLLDWIGAAGPDSPDEIPF